MNTELLIIGDELLNGYGQDSNGPFLASSLKELGFKINRMTVCGDNIDYLSHTIKEAWERSDILILTGGLGPTSDDLTREAIAKAFGLPLEISDKAQQLAHKAFQRIQKSFSSPHPYQYLPRGMAPLYNKVGLAPGLFYKEQMDHKVLFAFPGVPRELKGMWGDVLAQNLLPPSKLNFKTICYQVHGVSEEELFKKYLSPHLKELQYYAQLSSLPHIDGIDLLFHFQGEKEEEIIHKQTLFKQLFVKIVPSHFIWGDGSKSLIQKVIEKLLEKQESVVVIESMTAGQIASKFSYIPGASQVLRGGAVVYQREAKQKFLQLANDKTRSIPSVSEEMTLLLAQRGIEFFQSTWSLSITGYADETGDLPAGTLFIALASQGNRPVVKKRQIFGERSYILERATAEALHILLENI